MPFHTKTSIVIVSLITVIATFNEACQKELAQIDSLPVDQPVSPKLPAILFNYESESMMPDHIRNYIRSADGVDNLPPENRVTNEGATLGRVLFYDKNLSANNTIACGSCHHADKAFTDGKAVSPGFEGKFTRRNSMSLVNLRYFKARSMFWDMRASTLEEQVLFPFLDHIEMGISSPIALEKKVQSLSYYPQLFKAAFGTEIITANLISRALSQFLRSIVSFNSKYDLGLADNFTSFTPEELEGRRMINRAFCTECHSDLTNVAARNHPTFLVVENSGLNTGNGSNNALDEIYADKGIGEKTGLQKDMGTFKIPDSGI